MKKSRRKIWFFAVCGLVVVGLLIGLLTLLDFHFVTLNQVVAFVEMARSHRLIAMGFYILFAVGVMALPITMFPIIGGVLFPFWLALPLNLVAATIGAFLSFCLSRSVGGKFVEPYLRKNAALWQKVEEARGFQTVLLLRLVGIPPFIVTNYALGFSRVSAADFVVATAIGILPWMGIVTYLSHSLWQAVLVGGQEGLGKAMWHALGPLFFVSCVIATGMLMAHGMRRRRRHSNL